jgi:hypothetical protein
MIYRFCFHRGDGDDMPLKNRIVSTIIKRVSGGEFSHVELQRGIDGPCFSADGYVNRVRWKTINFSHPERWYVLEMPEVTEHEDRQILNRCNAIEGAKYDYIGAVTLAMRGPGIDRRYYCSKACPYVYGLAPINVFPAPGLLNLVILAGGKRAKVI